MSFFPFTAQALESLCTELDGWRRRLDSEGPLSRKWYGQLRRDLEVEAVAASVSMEQVPVTVEEVRRILVGIRTPGVAPEDQALVLGYRQAMEFALRRADDPSFRWSREVVVGLHDDVLARSFAESAGRFADADRWVIDRASRTIMFTPAPWREIPELVDRMCARLQEWENAQHPAIVSAWAHAVTAAIHPFRDGNGRVCRVLASLAMFRGGFKAREFTSLEEWWGRHVADYYAVFACLGTHFDAAADVTPFLQAHISAQLSQVRALDLRKQIERRVWAGLEELVEVARVKPRTIYALWEAFFEREVAASYYIEVADISKQTATNDLAALVAAGLLVPEGERRGRRYRSSDDLYRRLGALLGLEVPAGKRYTWIVGALSSRLAGG